MLKSRQESPWAEPGAALLQNVALAASAYLSTIWKSLHWRRYCALVLIIYLYITLALLQTLSELGFFFFFFFGFFRTAPEAYEVPRLGVESELQLPGLCHSHSHARS